MTSASCSASVEARETVSVSSTLNLEHNAGSLFQRYREAEDSIAEAHTLSVVVQYSFRWSFVFKNMDCFEHIRVYKNEM